MNDLEIQHAIDTCRPGGSDLNSPEFAELAAVVERDPTVRRRFEATQAFDGAVGAALQDVPVPKGLAERLLAAMQASAQNQVAVPVVSLPASRRPAVWSGAFDALAPYAALLMGVAALLALVVFSSAPPITPEQLVEHTFEWKEQLNHDRWSESLKTAPRDEFPLGSRAIIGPWRWQRVTSPGTDFVAYYGGPPDAYLFVVRTKSQVQGLGTSPSLLSSTGGWVVGAWQSGELTYVLVVEGDKRRYESHLKTQTPV